MPHESAIAALKHVPTVISCFQNGHLDETASYLMEISGEMVREAMENAARAEALERKKHYVAIAEAELTRISTACIAHQNSAVGKTAAHLDAMAGHRNNCRLAYANINLALLCAWQGDYPNARRYGRLAKQTYDFETPTRKAEKALQDNKKPLRRFGGALAMGGLVLASCFNPVALYQGTFGQTKYDDGDRAGRDFPPILEALIKTREANPGALPKLLP